MSFSPLAEIVPTWAISSLVETFFERDLTSSTTASTAMSMPRFRSIGLRPAATALDAFADDGLGQHGRGGGAVTGEVVGLRGHFAHHLGAHVLELVRELDLLGDGHAVLGDPRCAERFVDDDVAALRAQRHLDGVGQDVDAAQHRGRARRNRILLLWLPLTVLRYVTELNGVDQAALAEPEGGLDHAHDVRLFHHEILDAVELDLGARPFAEQDAVAGLDVERMGMALLVTQRPGRRR